MLVNSLLIIFMFLFSFLLFFINDLYIILLLFGISVVISILLKVRLSIYLSFIIILVINFTVNLLLSGIMDASIVTLRIILMFIIVNIIIKKIGIYNIGYTLGYLFHSRKLSLIIVIALSFIPIMIKELEEIKRSLVVKNFPLNFKNLLCQPSVFVLTFFTNLFKKVDELESVLISKGIE